MVLQKRFNWIWKVPSVTDSLISAMASLPSALKSESTEVGIDITNDMDVKSDRRASSNSEATTSVIWFEEVILDETAASTEAKLA